MAFEGARGATGQIRVGGRPAARLVNWVAVRDAHADTWTIGGGLAEANLLWLDQARTLDVALEVGKGSPWRWRRIPREAVTLTDTGISMTAAGRFER